MSSYAYGLQQYHLRFQNEKYLINIWYIKYIINTYSESQYLFISLIWTTDMFLRYKFEISNQWKSVNEHSHCWEFCILYYKKIWIVQDQWFGGTNTFQNDLLCMYTYAKVIIFNINHQLFTYCIRIYHTAF